MNKNIYVIGALLVILFVASPSLQATARRDRSSARQTDYGYVVVRNSKYVVVVPHALDEANTELVGEKVAYSLGATLVVNNKYFKATNSRASSDPEHIEDFNELDWNGYSYEWDDRVEAMHDFYLDLDRSNRDTVVVFIHGMRDSYGMGADIGAGVKWYNGELLGTDEHPNSGSYTGCITADLSRVQQLANTLDRYTDRYCGMSTYIGGRYAAWDRNTGTQWFCGTDDESIQIELARTIRNNPSVAAKMVVRAVRSAYG